MLKVFGSFVLDSTLLQDMHLINGLNLLGSLSVFCLCLCLSSLYYLPLENLSVCKIQISFVAGCLYVSSFMLPIEQK